MASRDELRDRLAEQMHTSADSVPGTWDRFAVVAEITALGVRVTGFRYQGDGPGLPMLMDDAMIQTIADIRDASPADDDQPFDIYVARLSRIDGRIDDQTFTAAGGRAFRVTASSVGLVADRVRPGVPLVAALPEAPPAETPPAETPPAEESSADTTEPDTSTAGAERAAEPVAPSPVDQSPVDGAPADGSPTDVTPTDPPAAHTTDTAPAEASGSCAAGPAGTNPNAAAPDAPSANEPPTDPAAAALSRLAATVASAPELSGDDWDGYGAVAVLPVDPRLPARTLGVRHQAGGPAIPTFVGGSFLADLRALRDASPDQQGRPAGAVLLRLARGQGPVAVRFVHEPSSVAAITWNGIEDAVVDRLRLQPRQPAVATIEPRRPGPQLSAAELVRRITDDVLASLRSRDCWATYTLAVDVPRSRPVSYVYTADGGAEPFRPPLSPLPDLTDLRERTARPDGNRWAGVRATAWAGHDRLDLVFYDAEGIDRYLAAGPQAAAAALRPASEPPSEAPRLPWPDTL